MEVRPVEMVSTIGQGSIACRVEQWANRGKQGRGSISGVGELGRLNGTSPQHQKNKPINRQSGQNRQRPALQLEIPLIVIPLLLRSVKSSIEMKNGPQVEGTVGCHDFFYPLRMDLLIKFF